MIDLLSSLNAALAGLGAGLLRHELVPWVAIGLMLAWLWVLQRSLRRMRQTLAGLSSAVAHLERRPDLAPVSPELPPELPASRPSTPAPSTTAVSATPLTATATTTPSSSSAASQSEPAQTPAMQTTPPAVTPTVLAAESPLIDGLVRWFQTGNLFLRVGILVLFFGVAFLIKYAVEREILVFTLQMRLLAIAVGAVVLLGLGGYLGRVRRDYGLLLQGAAIGMLYLDLYGAYQLYHLMPAWVALSGLLLIGLLAAALAIVQDAPALAWFGFAGGFLAPLAAGGIEQPHIALFGLYALLDGAILAVAWFKHWRALNLLGFGFSFGIAGVWGALRYTPELLATTQPFLILFFAFFVAITVLYTLRQPPRFKGWLDATLLFGTPALGFTYQVALVGHIEYAIAASAASLGLFYLLLALVIRPWADGLALLARAFQMLGVVFLSIAVPYALSEAQTAGIWALEGAGLVWIGARQRRPAVRALGLLLQAGAALALAYGYPYPSATAFLNPFYPAAAMLGVAGAVSAFWLDWSDSQEQVPDRQGWEHGGAAWLLLWGLAWWLGAGLLQLWQFFPGARFPAALLIYAAVTGLLAEAAASLWPWPRLRRAQTALPLLGLVALVSSIGAVAHPVSDGGATAWPLLLATCWLLLARGEPRAPHSWLLWGHLASGLLLAAVLQWEVLWRLLEHWQLVEGWRVAAFALVPAVLLQLAIHAGGWPLGRWRSAYALLLGGALAAVLAAWGVWSAASPGGSAPFFWLPVLNPADLMLALVLLTLYHWSRLLHRRLQMSPTLADEPVIWILLGGLAFLWLNLVLLRVMHHWWGIAYTPAALLDSVPTQMAVSVLWGLTGVGLLLAARRAVSRPLWFSGAAVLAAVVTKLFVIDLAATGTLERIISFLAVGALLMGVGWFAQLPPRETPLAGQGVSSREVALRHER